MQLTLSKDNIDVRRQLDQVEKTMKSVMTDLRHKEEDLEESHCQATSYYNALEVRHAVVS